MSLYGLAFLLNFNGERHASACRYKKRGTGGLTPLRSPVSSLAARSIFAVNRLRRRNHGVSFNQKQACADVLDRDAKALRYSETVLF